MIKFQTPCNDNCSVTSLFLSIIFTCLGIQGISEIRNGDQLSNQAIIISYILIVTGPILFVISFLNCNCYTKYELI